MSGGGDRYARYAGASCRDVTVWVDPLDGTREFVEGPEHWSVGGYPREFFSSTYALVVTLAGFSAQREHFL